MLHRCLPGGHRAVPRRRLNEIHREWAWLEEGRDGESCGLPSFRRSKDADSDSCKPIGDRRSPQEYGGSGDVAEVAIQRAYDLDEARSGTRDNTQARGSTVTKGPRKRSEKVLKTGGLRRG